MLQGSAQQRFGHRHHRRVCLGEGPADHEDPQQQKRGRAFDCFDLSRLDGDYVPHELLVRQRVPVQCVGRRNIFGDANCGSCRASLPLRSPRTGAGGDVHRALCCSCLHPDGRADAAEVPVDRSRVQRAHPAHGKALSSHHQL